MRVMILKILADYVTKTDNNEGAVTEVIESVYIHEI